MHQSSFNLMKYFKDFIENNFEGQRVKILDVGSYGVNGTYREVFSNLERFDYLGLDLTPGPNVDYVPSDPYKWDELADRSFDVIISGQAFEHIEFPWLTILEMKKKLKDNGLICIIAPSRGPEHRYPVDCWRYYPDGFHALAKWAGLEVIECRTNWGPSGFRDGSDQWGDTFCILRKRPELVEVRNPIGEVGNLSLPFKHAINNKSPLNLKRPDYYFSIARKEIADLLKRDNICADRVLEIGAASGATGRFLKEKGMVKEYIGVEISESAAVMAKKHLDEVIVADIERVDLEKEHGLRKEYFDLILCLDVLEHLYDPWEVLARLKKFLKPDGHLIASLPNVQHITVIKGLLEGRWRYESAGILDATHVRFFTLQDMLDMFDGAGFSITRLDRTFNPLLDLSKVREKGNNIDLGKAIINDLSRDEVMNIFTYQFLITAKKQFILKEKLLPLSRESRISEGLTSIVIVTFNQLEYTKKCVESLKRCTLEPHEIIFVDNGSKDGTLQWLRKLVSENSNYRLIENKENLGFAKGCNQGIQFSRGEYIVLLNNDVIVTERWLSGLLDCLKRAPDAGIVGPMTNNISGHQKVEVNYKDENGIEDFAKRFRETYRGRRIPLRRIVGFCMLFRKELIDKIGLLDESFGTGNFEDDDLCLRAELAGFRNYIAGDVFIHHYGSRSFIGNKIDYNSTMGGNRKRFNEKWNALGLDWESQTGKALLCLRILERAEELYQKGKFDLAIKALVAGLKRQPENKSLLYSLAEKLIDLKQYDHCLSILKELGVDDLRLSLFRGYCEEGLGNIDSADRIASDALSHNGNNPLALNLKGIVHYRKGNRDMASQYFRQAIEADPGYGEPYTNLGVITWASGNRGEAIEYLEKGFKLSPNVSDIASLYHSAISGEGLYERAEKVFEEVVRRYPLKRQNIFFYIDILLKTGSYEKAMDLIEKSIVRFGVDDEFINAALVVRERLGYRRITPAQHGSQGAHWEDKIFPVQNQVFPIRKWPTLSLCMIVKNEEGVLAQCLESVKALVDEIVIVDTGSQDRTKEIARVFGARVYDFPWNGDFSEARNLSLDKAEGDWILVLDADEVIAEKDHRVIREFIQRGKRKAYQMTTRNYMNRIVTGWRQNTGEYPEERGSGWMPSVKTRLFPNDKRLRFENPIHELIDYAVERAGYKIKICPVPVHHYGKLNEKKTEDKFQLYYELGKKKLEGSDNKPKALYELAIQASEMGRLDEAVQLWEELIKLKPEFGHAYVSLSRVYCELKRFDEAKEMAVKAVRLVPQMKEAYYALGLGQFYLGEFDEAMKNLQSAVKIDPDFPLPFALLALCQVLKGDKEGAKEYIEKVRTMGFDYPSFAEVILSKAS